MAEFERELIRERSQAGQRNANPDGVTLPRTRQALQTDPSNDGPSAEHPAVFHERSFADDGPVRSAVDESLPPVHMPPGQLWPVGAEQCSRTFGGMQHVGARPT